MTKKDDIEVANKKTVEEFVESYFPDATWKTWTHPITKTTYHLSMQTASALSPSDFTACFNLIESTSSEDYRKSKEGWKPKAKKREMKLLDLKYLLVKRDTTVEGFVSFMPTYEDDFPVVYCYEIHLREELRGTGLAATLVEHLSTIGQNIPSTAKVMLTVFTRNERAVSFYSKLGYTKDEFSPPPRILRNGTKVEAEYVILSKAMSKS